MSFDSRIQGNNFFRPVNPINPAGGQRTQGTTKAPSFTGGNSLINSNDFNDFKANFLSSCNPNKPAALNSDPAAGVLRSFDLTA